MAIDPGRPYVKQVTVPADANQHDLRASISVRDRELVAYSPIRLQPEAMPKPVEPPPQPAEITDREELYLTGLRIEQFHNPTLDPDPYWEEALRRDPGDVRVNTALGITLLQEGQVRRGGEAPPQGPRAAHRQVHHTRTWSRSTTSAWP